MAEYKTPGVYIKEKNAFGTSVVEAETAIPAFIGFTEKAKLREDGDLNNVPWKISSMNEFIQYFGEAPKPELKVELKKIHGLTPEQAGEDKKLPDETLQDGLFMYVDRSHEYKEKFNLIGSDGKVEANQSDVPFNYAFCISGKHPYSLFYQMQMFFANGGSTCYVVSTGLYSSTGDGNLTSTMVKDALEKLEKEREVTLIVVPEAVSSNDCASIQQNMMKHCNDMGNRFAILDVPTGDKDKQLDKQIEDFQNTVTNYFFYGAAYFPWLNTTVLSDRDLTGDMFVWKNFKFLYMKQLRKMDAAFYSIIQSFCGKKETVELKTGEKGKKVAFPDDKLEYTFKFEDYSSEKEYTDKDLIFDVNENGEKVDNNEGNTNNEGDIKDTCEIIDLQQTKDNGTVSEVTLTVVLYSKDRLQNKDNLTDRINLHQALYNASPLYKQAIQGVLKQLNLLPPSAAMAGIYTMVDHSRGVWKAPANVSLNYVDSPAENLDDDEQANLNAPMNGKAVNVIRLFHGEGVKVWGARTLDGNSLDWRYINVRRTLLFLEESVKNAARAYVFEPNDAGTWINMKCMIENFLRSVWKRGGLAGSTPEEAFEVHVGLGDTMTGDDILEGIMRITVLVAVTHPAEFIEITFQQQMQKS
ncbi:phage tail sheath C-terminal domain-containing protein [Bacteroides sp. An19]|uniref:phage tail sheath family protein n=1 Tax=Bacteroides sp. An19 TaxID=1965580 RepID=UPI000B3841BA|nr:phage tail sheath C-terminal domain-containing protein [Bacteroides sp. An19]OUP35620.1 hypothetical protein B5F25_04220 [Bacteroides sp. An19]